ncbi:hypothetical protein N1851_021770 [Merluccius polli]|uniref:SCAN box domain-containing protein n=1 Tax=Merluccius polli TaxID=89951 RepID=A0AA47MJG8_MERPO|nr:hypothetical protein N1851_021770 [Merluccius polli]
MNAEELRLTLRIKEVEVRQRELEVETMHLKVRALELERGAAVAASPLPMQTSTPSPHDGFDVSRHIALVPPFRESEVDSFFSAFEHIATTLHWPKSVWPLLLQCKLVGKAQEVCNSLSIEDSLNYDIVKATVLRTYEIVPEAYRQKFRNCGKAANQTYVEFAREKSTLFDKWCQASKVATFDNLRELIVLEEFKNRLPEKIVIYLSEQKVTCVTDAAVLADEYLLTHKSVFSPPVCHDLVPIGRSPRSPKNSYRNPTAATGDTEERVCFYCHEQGHLIAVCPTLRRKEPCKSVKTPFPIGFIHTKPHHQQNVDVVDEIDEDFKPFVTQGSVSLEGMDKPVPITILRDTGAVPPCLRVVLSPLVVAQVLAADWCMDCR